VTAHPGVGETSVTAPEPQDEMVLAVSAFAIEHWQARLSGDLTGKQTVKAANTFTGRLSSLAMAREITPPERALDILSEDGRTAALDLLKDAIDFNAHSPKQTSSSNTRRFQRILKYADHLSDDENEGDHMPDVIYKEEEA
jgi:hypothetical protein